MKKVLAISFCALAIVLLVVVVQKSGIVRNPGSQLAQVAYTPVPQTSPINPVAYFQFDGATSNVSSVGSKYLSTTSGGTSMPSFQVLSGGKVGKYASVPYSNTPQRYYITSGTGFTNAFAVEFMLKPGRGFDNTDFFQINDGSVMISYKVSPPRGSTLTSTNYLFFRTKDSTGTVNDFTVDMNGANQRSWAYLTDGNWHHLVFKRNIDGTKEIWVDGTLPSGFATTAPSGNLLSTSATSTAWFNSVNSNRKYVGDLDEIALYNTELPGNLIKQHYDDMVAGVHYQNWTSVTSVMQGGSTTGALDPRDYAPGITNLDTAASYSQGITDKPLAQLSKFPLPRYKAGHSLLPNILWADMQYQAQITANAVDDNSSIASNAYNIMKELATNFGYAITINNVQPGQDYSTASATTKYRAALAKLANDYPAIPLAVITYRAQINPKLTDQTLSSSHYLQNGSGQFVNTDNSGNVITIPSTTYPDRKKLWRPGSGTPPADYQADGDFIKNGLTNLINSLPARVAANPTKVINLINDNGEIVHSYSDTLMGVDPLVVSDSSSAGLSLQKFMARKYYENVNQAYSGRFLSLSGLQDTTYTEYPHEGGPSGRMDWSEVRNVNSAINGQKYPTGDFYPCWATNWKEWTGPWHGWGWFNESLKNSLASGDKYSSMFISPGWWTNATKNYTPAQYLGLVKNLANSGSEFFYTGFFNNTGDCNWNPVAVGLPESYTWQDVIAPYVQALVSRVDSFYKSSSLMQGDAPVNVDNVSTLGYGYSWLTNDPNALVVVRKSDTSNKYLISTNLNQSTNLTGNVSAEKNLTIKLGGNDVTFKSRRQGSMYIYDNTTPSSPVFYQLDAWHEVTHPSYWSKNFSADAEIYDTGTATIKTTNYSGTDFSNADSYITSTGNVSYNFMPRSGSGTTFSLWVRARSSSASTASMSINVDGGASQSLPVAAGAFQWVKLVGTFTATTGVSHVINFSIPGIDFDKFILTPDATFVPSGYTQASDTTPPTAPANLTSPAKTDQSVDLSWTASTDDTAVVAYDVYKNSVLAGSSISTSYTASGLTPSTAYNFSVKARDAAGNVSNASVTLSVTTNAQIDTTPPSTPSSLVSSALTSNSVQIDWAASIDNVGVTAYEVSKNGTVVAASVGTTSYTATGLSPQTAYSFTVRAKDAAGNWSAPSSVLSVTTPAIPDTTAPAGSISAPVSGATLSNTATITVAASDNIALDHIDFYRGGTTLIGSAIASGASGNFSLGWNTTTVTDGSYSLTAKIYDASGNSSTTSAVSVTVTNVVTPPADTTPPVVSVSYPSTGSTVSGVVAIGANATDNVGVTKVMFYRSTALIGTDTTASPWEVSLDTTVLNNGNYAITAKAYDAANNVTTSSAVTITVNNVVADTTKPTASFTSPADGATVTGSSVVLTANATDNVGIDTVKFYQSNGTLLGTGTAVGSNNYSFTWDTTSLANGSQTLYAIAYDTSGNFQQTANKTVTVNNVDTVNPSNVTGLTASNITPTTVTLSWNPATDNVALKGYDVYTGTNTAATRFVTGAPGTSYTVTGLTANTNYTLKVVARDTSDNTSITEASVSIKTLKTDSVAPVATWVSPQASNGSSGSKFTMGSVVTLTATATDDVAMKKVEFRIANGNGTGTVLCTVTAAPYTCNWTVPQTVFPTGYNVRAVAWDTSMNSGTTQWVYLKSKY